LSWFEGVKGVDIVDKYTVNIKTDGPNAALPMRVSTHPAMMLPPKYFQQVGEAAFFQKPVGTGPYKFVEWVKNDHLTIEANPDYWGPNKPVYKTVMYKPAPEASTRLAMLQTGQADIITNVPPDMAKALEADQKLGVATVPGAGIIMYQLNTFSDGPLKDKRVRQALNYAIDRDALVKNVLLGYARTAPGVAAPQTECFDTSVKGYGYDPEKARSLLKDAGASGMTLRMLHPTGRYVLDKEVAQAIADQIRKVGVEVNLETYEWGRYLQIVTNPDVKQRPDLFVVLFGTGGGTGVPELAWYPMVQGKQTFSMVDDPQLNGLLGQAGKELNAQKRCDVLNQAQEMAYDLAPRIFLYQQNVIYGYNKSKFTLDPRVNDYIDIVSDIKPKQA
jgi:peptide/nickel transport system substrate-binding protein